MAKMEVNEKLVRVSAGLVPIEQELELGDDVRLVIEGTVVKEEHEDQNDGTINVIFVVKGVVAYVGDEATD